ncbi:complement receptor type 1-like isoform 2-T2 [Leptodactylus fuscus]|uniref:complement receptor type 1-like isoform X2 n=1 Tax=Leptodactylus fuscus TaxID=238119 RepID=UPI003F4EDF26
MIHLSPHNSRHRISKMRLLAIGKRGSTLLLVLFLANFTGKSHAQAALDFADIETSTVNPTTQISVGCEGHACEYQTHLSTSDTNTQDTDDTPGEYLTQQSNSNNQYEDDTIGEDLTQQSSSNNQYEGLCSSPPHIAFAKLKEDFSEEKKFIEGDVISYECITGYVYVPGATNTVMCMADGTWSTPDTFCKCLCSSPPEIPFAKLKEDFLEKEKFIEGDVISYECITGYVYVPGATNTVMCMDNGTWSIPDTFCKPNVCGSPPRLEYAQAKEGYLDRTTFPVGSKISFACRPGFIRVPSSKAVATCMDNTEWLMPDTFCARRSCGYPGDVDNGEMLAKDFLFGSRATYTCNYGYRISSRRNYRDCMADGTWSNYVPICTVISCTSPPNIKNGHYYPEKEDYDYLDSVTYTCNGRLALIGEQSISCTGTGEWSSNPPECKDIRCPTPYVENASKLSGFTSPYSLNSAVRFQCWPQYRMIGSSTVKCNESSKWEPELPKCLGVCHSLPSLTNAELEEPTTEISFLEGTTLKLKCKEGFELVSGELNTVTCVGLVWSAFNSCKRKTCKAPETVPHGRILHNSSSFSYEDIIAYTCNTGYKIKDISYRRCLSNQSWSLPIPECEVETCTSPRDINDGWSEPEMEIYLFNNTVTYGCHEQYQLVGESSVTCHENGMWKNKIPECKGICDKPPTFHYAELQSGIQHNKTYLVGDTVEYYCKRGYFSSGTSHTISCLANLTWSIIPEFCIRKSCGRPPTVENTIIEVKNYLYESEAVYKCKKGYKMIAQGEPLKCGSNKKWNGSVPTCQVQKCLPPKDVKYGSYSPKKDEYTYGETVTYTCNTSALIGKASAFCVDEGKWSSDAPQCRDACTVPPELDFAVLGEEFKQFTFFDIGITVQYRCRPGFVRVNHKNNTLKCLNDGTWSQHALFCTPISCAKPLNINHGRMEFDDLTFGSRVNYTCDPGYTMVSKRNYRVCQADRTWSGKPPVCKEPVCEHIWELQEEARRCTSTPDEWIKYLQVQYLYLQIENMKLDIEIKKRQLIRMG